MKDLDWPDHLDTETGIFTYFGDNKKPGHELHDTPRFGNLLLRDMFERAHGSKSERALVPPVSFLEIPDRGGMSSFSVWPCQAHRI